MTTFALQYALYRLYGEHEQEIGRWEGEGVGGGGGQKYGGGGEWA